MADEYRSIERDNTTHTKTNNGMPFIVGGLVVAVGVILWLVFGGGVSTSTAPTDSTTTNSVTVEPTAPAATEPAADPVPTPAPAEPAEPAPAPAPAPADPVTPPVTGTAPATP